MPARLRKQPSLPTMSRAPGIFSCSHAEVAVVHARPVHLVRMILVLEERCRGAAPGWCVRPSLRRQHLLREFSVALDEPWWPLRRSASWRSRPS